MPSRFAVAAGGNFSATSTWSATTGGASGASVPTTGDTAILNAKTVVMDGTTITCDKITSFGSNYSGADGGNLTVSLVSQAKTINAAIEAATTTCVTVTGSAFAFVLNGTLTSGFGGSSAQGMTISGTASQCTFNGNISSGAGSAAAALNCMTASPTINGNVAAGAGSPGVTVSTGTVTVNGSITAGAGSGAHGVSVTSTGGKCVCNSGNLIDSSLALAVGGLDGCLQFNAGATNYHQVVTSTGTLNLLPSTSSTDPGIAKVALGTAYTINGATMTGTGTNRCCPAIPFGTP